jgi:hypothetical protein
MISAARMRKSSSCCDHNPPDRPTRSLSHWLLCGPILTASRSSRSALRERHRFAAPSRSTLARIKGTDASKLELMSLTAPLMPSCLFQTGSIELPASRFLCEHLHQNLFWACISRIHAQVPLVTSGKLTESLHQQIPCGIDVSVMGYPAFRARPKPRIQPQLIEYVPAPRAGLA